MARCRKIRTFIHAGRNVKQCSLYSKQYGSSSKSNKRIELPYDPAAALLDTYPEEWKAGSQRYLYTYVHSSIIQKSLEEEATEHFSVDKQTKCSLSIRWDVMQTNREEILTPPRTWTNLEDIVLLLLLLLSRFSRVRLCATPWTAAHQAPPPLGFSRQEHWSGLPFPSPILMFSVT